jgi:hypothetical protein
MNAQRPAFTLLETILTLALAVVVLGLLGMAVDVHLRVADASRNAVEETQAARLLLKQITDDLRNAIPITQTPTSYGCLQGTSNELQVDISCQPLLDETQVAATARESALPISPPSDVRTVAYFVAKPGDLQSPNTSGLNQPGDSNQASNLNEPLGSVEPGGGLLRRECERATYAWAVQQGQTDQMNRALEVLSLDVVSIEFTYIDAGTSYQEWDSTQQGKLPGAVKVSLSIRQRRRQSQALSGRGTIGERPLTVYTAVVALPNAQATLDKTIASDQSATASQAAKSNDSSSQGTANQGSTSQGTTNQGSNSKGSSGKGTGGQGSKSRGGGMKQVTPISPGGSGK